MRDTKALAKWKWRSILSNFIDPKLLGGPHGACPICGGKDRFRFDDYEGSGNYICSQCGAGTGIHLLAQAHSISHSEAWVLVESVIGKSVEEKPKPTADRAARINRIIKASTKISKGGDVHRYLYSRGLRPDYTSLRLGEVRGVSDNSIMVGRFHIGNKLAGLHVTFLQDGQKAEREGQSSKKMFAFEKDGLKGSAIRLHPLLGATKLIIAEGIETALSVSQKLSIPAWATGSAQLMETVQIPEQITDVILAGDNDTSYTGQASAFVLAKRLVNSKNPKNVTVIFPSEIGTDFNDELMREISLDKRVIG